MIVDLGGKSVLRSLLSDEPRNPFMPSKHPTHPRLAFEESSVSVDLSPSCRTPKGSRGSGVREIYRQLSDSICETLARWADQGHTDVHDDEWSLMPLNPVRVVLALSGGRDSMAMLDVLGRLCADPNQCLIGRVAAVYINHQLSAHAKAWAAHCEAEARKRNIPFVALTVEVNAQGQGIEAGAREARYEALLNFARQGHYDAILTAHHGDDRLETFLLQWMRGAGIEGLAGIPSARTLVEGDEATVLLRPWLGVSRQSINSYVRSRRLRYVEDDSNADERFTRNKLRRHVIPLLEAARPGFKKAAARSIDLMGEALSVLKSVAQEDAQKAIDPEDSRTFHLPAILSLVPERQAWALRWWFGSHDLMVPNKARLDDFLRQLHSAQADRSVTMRLDTVEIKRWGNVLKIVPVEVRPSEVGPQPQGFLWDDQTVLACPQFHGELHFERVAPGEAGLPISLLRSGALSVRARSGSERLKLFTNRPTKTLKDWFSQAKVPSFERSNCPTVWLDEQLLFVARLGHDVRWVKPSENEPCVRIRFRSVGGLWEVDPFTNFNDEALKGFTP